MPVPTLNALINIRKSKEIQDFYEAEKDEDRNYFSKVMYNIYMTPYQINNLIPTKAEFNGYDFREFMEGLYSYAYLVAYDKINNSEIRTLVSKQPSITAIIKIMSDVLTEMESDKLNGSLFTYIKKRLQKPEGKITQDHINHALYYGDLNICADWPLPLLADIKKEYNTKLTDLLCFKWFYNFQITHYAKEITDLILDYPQIINNITAYEKYIKPEYIPSHSPLPIIILNLVNIDVIIAQSWISGWRVILEKEYPRNAIKTSNNWKTVQNKIYPVIAKDRKWSLTNIKRSVDMLNYQGLTI